jgi:DNA (cytosine-5)-methyltransferase 1
MEQTDKPGNGRCRRLIEVTAGNLRNNHIYITGMHDFFPSDTLGGPDKNDLGKPVAIELDGLPRIVRTDIPRDAKTGRPRRQFRARGWAREFFAHHGVMPGDVLSLERMGKRSYRLAINKRNGHKWRFMEFFAGIGLVRLGLERAGWTLAYANDIDSDKREMYETHFGDADEHFELEDIHKLSGRQLPDAMLATASFPCTDLSLAGGRKGLSGAQSSAFFGFINVLEEMGNRRPPLVLLENVVAFLNSRDGADFECAMTALNELGYYVDPFILDAKWFVPQSRPRLFVVASQIPNEEKSRPLGAWWSNRLRPELLSKYIDSHPGIRWSIRCLPEPPAASGKSLTDILEDLPPDAPEWWGQERAKYLYDQMSRRHRAIAEHWIAANSWSYGTVFRRVRRQQDGHKRSMGELRCDGIAGCLRTPKGGSGRQILFKAGYGMYAARLLTPRECARLMGADDFKLSAPLNQALFGFGDAVCVPALTWIAENYLNQLARRLDAEPSMIGSLGDTHACR